MASQRKLRAIVTDIRKFCKANADENQATRYARYFTEGYDAYGVHQDVFMEKKAALAETCRESLALNEALTLGEMLLRSGKYEEASFAILLPLAYQDRFTKTAFKKLGTWLEKGIRNWGHTDVLCCEVLSQFFERGVVTLPDLAPWRRSPSKWRRRAVPVTLVSLLKTAKSLKPLLDLVTPMMMDEDRFVQQGLGWFLREAWKKQRKPVEALLLKWKERAPRKIYQYATEKMTKAEKERYRRKRKK
jgi:3-methyladenine DNA glycosylase AlkD